MRASIRRLHTPDAAGLHEYRPADDADFSLCVQVLVGPSSAEGEESFDLEVVTPANVARRLARTGPMSGRHLLLVDRFDPAAIERWLHRAVARCEAPTWRELALQLSQVGHWEFDDYAP